MADQATAACGSIHQSCYRMRNAIAAVALQGTELPLGDALIKPCAETIGVAAPGTFPRNEILSEKGTRGLQTARQRRLDRPHVSPSVECFAGKEHRPTIAP
jgi:hypothetical protein